MPFTPSHAVVVLPFVRTPLVPAAIAVGAMTPDLPLFVRGTVVSYALTHSNVLVSALLALVLLVAWYQLMRPAVRELSPAWLASRLPREWDASGLSPWRGLRGRRGTVTTILLVAASLALGVVSHIVWDAFTHEGRLGMQLLPVLGANWGPLPGYKWLQHGGSVVGLGLLLAYGANWLRKQTPESTLPRLFAAWVRTAWWVMLPVALVAAWIVGLAAYGPFTEEWTPQHLAYRVLPPACAIWAVATIALCVLVQIRRKGQQTA